MRAAHLLDRCLNPAPVDGFGLLALPFAFGGLLGGLKLGLVAMGADEAPRVVVDFSGFHGTVLLLIAETRGANAKSEMRRLRRQIFALFLIVSQVWDSKFRLSQHEGNGARKI